MKIQHVLFVLVLLGLYAGPASAVSVVCPPVPDGLCEIGQENSFCPVLQGTRCLRTAGNPDGLAEMMLLRSEPIPEAEVQVTCLYTGGGYACDAWPKSSELSYAWTKFGNVQWVNAPYVYDTAEVTCSPGLNNRVNVTVTSPGGFSSLVTAYIYCGASGEY